MTITEGKTVSIEYTLKLENEEVVDTNVGGEPLKFTQGSKQIIPGLEKEMEGMGVGDSKQVTVTPEEGYGPVYQEAVAEFSKDSLPPDVWKVGAVVQGKSQAGQVLRGFVTEINEDDDKATIDFNHPLAGKTLLFDVKVLEVQ